LPTVVAYWSWSYVLARVPVSRAAIYTYLVPVLSAVRASVWLGERPTLGFGIGAALALAGVVLATAIGETDERAGRVRQRLQEKG